MATLPPLGEVLNEQYMNRPREYFYQTLRRLDRAGRLALIEKANESNLKPTRQPPFPDIIEERRALAAERAAKRGTPDDFAARIETIRDRLERFEETEKTKEAWRDRFEETGKLESFASITERNRAIDERYLTPREQFGLRAGWEKLTRGELYADRSARRDEPPRVERRVREDSAERPAPKSPTYNLADPVLRGSKIQFLTGSQLDLLF